MSEPQVFRSMDDMPRDGTLKSGDRVTFEGHYRPRTFWQWLTRQPKQLQEFVVFGSPTNV